MTTKPRLFHIACLMTTSLIAGMLAGCGGSSGGAASAAPDPISCLEASGLSSAEERSPTLWRANHDGPFYQVTVNEYDNAAAAKSAFFAATDVYISYGGPYTVDGPAKPAAGGLVTAAEGDEAQRIVAEVSSCLTG